MVNEIDLLNKLKGAGVQPKQAEAHVETMKQYSNENLANKKDIQQINNRFDSIDSKFVAVDNRFDALENKFTALENKFIALENKFTALENKFIALENKFTALENKVEDLGDKILLKLFWLNVGFFTIAGVVLTLVIKI